MKKLPFLWEIGCEEIPASWLPALVEEIGARVANELTALGLEAEARSHGTLRRLVVHVPELADRQDDRVEQVTGPPLSAARDEDGGWSRAALGFARKNEIDPGELSILKTPRGEYVGFERKIRGEKTPRLLPGVMARTLRGLSFPKFMNWDAALDDGKGAFPFGRPIRWILAIFGSRVVPFEIQVIGSPPIRSGRKTRGHRFLGPRGARAGAPFAVSSFEELEQGLEKHFVVLDPGLRRSRLEKEIARLEKKARSRRAPGLSLDLVAELVEWPGAVLGAYPAAFLSLPDEVRHTVLIHHQHYFPLLKKPAFIAVTNMASDRKGNIRRGAERVVVARLRDAKFFWDEDLKRSLEDREKDLDGVLFHEKLGSYRRKKDRLVPLALWIAARSGGREAPVRRSASLAKCDLVTGMVGEFPELQGVMGGLYAREQSEPDPVWKAIYSHYRPSGLGEDDDFPLNREGAIVALADKIDTVAAMFSVGVIPTGSRDPFGLRRSALGAIRILLESERRLSFEFDVTGRELLREALRVVEESGVAPDSRAGSELEAFFAERLRYVFSLRFRYDEINSVFAGNPLDRPATDLEQRLEAVAAARGSADFEALSAAFKRVGNILTGKKAGTVDPDVLFETEEKELFSSLEALEPVARRQVAERRYQDALHGLSSLRPRVDSFFEEVMVMSEDGRLRDNRLALLARLRALFSEVADLSEIVPQG